MVFDRGGSGDDFVLLFEQEDTFVALLAGVVLAAQTVVHD